jgi:hypothetical protein
MAHTQLRAAMLAMDADGSGEVDEEEFQVRRLHSCTLLYTPVHSSTLLYTLLYTPCLPPCKIHTVYVWRVLQGGRGVYLYTLPLPSCPPFLLRSCPVRQIYTHPTRYIPHREGCVYTPSLPVSHAIRIYRVHLTGRAVPACAHKHAGVVRPPEVHRRGHRAAQLLHRAAAHARTGERERRLQTRRYRLLTPELQCQPRGKQPVLTG